MISVIVPIYNVEEYLPACIESILNQTYKDLEILLIDDGSTDNSGKICDDYAERDKRCIVIHQQNKGLSGARNTGLDNAQGECISFIDGDDYIHPQMLEILYNEIRKGDFDFSMILYKKIWKYQKLQDPIVTYTIQSLSQEQLMKSLFNKSPSDVNLQESYFQAVWNKLYSSRVIGNSRFIKTRTEDTEFNNRIYLKCNRAVLVNVEAYYWFQRCNSLCHLPFSLYTIDFINSYYICWQEIPEQQQMYKGLCLEKLYKTIINICYYANNSIYKKYVNDLAKKLVNDTQYFFWRNYYIKLPMKIMLMTFYKVPFLYKIFMWLVKMRSLVLSYFDK
jgi:glycosyltransferase involved in cell wall biosynthesis